MPSPLTVILDRNSDQWVTSYDVWAKRGAYPLDHGDGLFVGNVAIAPSALTASTSWTPPSDGTYYFAAITIYNRSPGLFFQLNNT